MAQSHEIEEKFWKSLKSDRTVMLSLANAGSGPSKPMTVQLEEHSHGGPLWIFTAKDTELVAELGGRGSALIHFASKGHDLFATVEGTLTADNDRAAIERLWNPFVAAWYDGGKDDPNLQLLRFDPEHAQIWLNENSLFAGVRMLIGRDPKKDYQDKVADVRL